MKSKVAVLKTTPETVLEDYGRLIELAGCDDYLDKKRITILKNNISWHFPFQGPRPWQARRNDHRFTVQVSRICLHRIRQ